MVLFQRLETLELVLVEDDQEAQPCKEAEEDIHRTKDDRRIGVPDQREEQQGEPGDKLHQETHSGHTRRSLKGVVVDSHVTFPSPWGCSKRVVDDDTRRGQ